MEIPKIGNAKGIFEIFIPGSFLLLNIVGLPILFFFPEISYAINISTIELNYLLNPIISLIVLICFGYLTGMILRLLKPGKPDKLSAKKLKDSNKMDDEVIYTSIFPYIELLKYQMDNSYYNKSMNDFFEKTWLTRIDKGEYSNHHFFNFYKYMTCFNDENAAIEILSAESLTRYLTGIFYALRFSQILLAIGFIILSIKTVLQILENIYSVYNITALAIVAFVFILYSYSSKILLENFRFIRIKEVVTVLIGSYKNRDLFI